MPEDELIDPDQDGLDENIRAALKGRNQLAKDKAAAEERATQLERELAFSRAGVPDTPLVAALAKTYDGENDAASVKAYFESLGVDLLSSSAGVSSNQTPPPQGASEDELAAQRQLAQVGSGGELGGDVDFAEAINSAKSASEVQALLDSAPQAAKVMNPMIQ
jgi:hypothetical protein